MRRSRHTPRRHRTALGSVASRRGATAWAALIVGLGGRGLIAAAGDAGALRLPPELHRWEHSVNLRVRGGYDDNVLLSSFAPEGSAFLGGGVEAMLWRALGERTTLEAFLSGEYQHFLGSDNVDHEGNAFGLVQVRHGESEAWQAQGAFEYLYQNEILDVSATEPTLEVLPVEGHTLIARPAVRRKLGRGSFELEVPVERQLFQSPLDDTWRAGPRLAGSLSIGSRDDLTLSYAWGRTWYDTEPDRAADGQSIPGSRREMTDQDVRLGWKRVWDEARRWQTTARISGRWSSDHASGYYDYTRIQAGAQVRYRCRAWEVIGDARFTHFDYPEQTASATDPTLRRRSEVTCHVAVERALTDWLRVFADYAFDHTEGNRREDEYTVNTVSAGLNFEF